MNTQDMTPEQLRRLGIEALNNKLGPVATVRFLQLFDKGVGDYTQERRDLMKSLDVPKIVEEIRSKKKPAAKK